MSDTVPMYGFGGGGGGGLNFKVVGGTTQPTKPTENTIWVNTSVNIASWAFSATEPASPKEGMVWISTGTTSTVEFNALKKNSIQVYPLYAKQYISGAWVSKAAKSYQGGEWQHWFRYIYNAGDEYNDITGGWTSSGYTWDNGSTSFAIKSPTKNADNMLFTGTAGSSGTLPGIGTENAIDLSNVSILEVDVNVIATSSDGSSTFYLAVMRTKNFSAGLVAHVGGGNGTGEKTLQLDVSKLSGSYYIGASMSFGNTNRAELYRIRMA